MIRRLALISFLVSGAVALAPFAPSPAFAQTDTSVPAIALSLGAATVGQDVAVTGQNFPAVSSVAMQLCGNEARGGSTDCDVIAGQTIVTDENGSFQGHVVVRFPPVPCPCVVWAASNGSTPASATAPIGVVTASYNPPPAPTRAASATLPALVVVRAGVRQHGTWRGWIGLPTRAELDVTLRNDGPSTIDHPVLSLTSGKGSDPITVIESPQIDALRAGEERTIVVPVDLSALAFGRYTFKGVIGSSDVVFRVHTSVVPFGPIVVIIALPSLTVVVRRRLRRRRLAEQPARPAAVVGTGSLLPIAPADEVDAPTTIIEPNFEPVLELTAPTVQVTFTFPDWVATESVALCGEFNDWSPKANPMTRLEDGTWETVVDLRRAWCYRYRFLLDGDRWENDWSPDAYVPNSFGTRDSLIVIGAEDRCSENTKRERPPDREDLPILGSEQDPNEEVFEAFWAEESEAARMKVRRWLR
ncbi:MAG: hypothetical protein QOI95_3593 [Acidimicrobiaceae bacterium]|jgi:hypothetical protein